MRHLCVVLLVISIYFIKELVNGGKFSWLKFDAFDDTDARKNAINGKNCQSKPKADMVFRPDTVSQIPKYNQLMSKTWYKNRSSLIHLHNTALNRAFFYSFVLQKMNDSASFFQMPNWFYMYLSVTADVHANPYGINGSAIFFDTNCSYPNWYTTVPFNNTLTLFAPKAWRHDDALDQGNFLREPTRQTVKLMDMAAGGSSNYTHPLYKMNPWYSKYMPDLDGHMDSLTKFTYSVGIKYSNETGRFTTEEFQTSVFFGPPSPGQDETDERMLPVVFTQPYFDCGAANTFIVSAVSPVVDYMPRFSNWTHLRRQRFVASIVMDIHFNKIDFNACPVSIGNPGPSYLSGISRCNKKSTSCKHKMGFGFSRGGYVCVCKAGYSYPIWAKPPYQGGDIEKATEDEYKNGFQCTHTDYRLVLPQVDQLEGITVEGGSNTLTSGGVDLGKSNAFLTDKVKSRRLKSFNDTDGVSVSRDDYVRYKLEERDYQKRLNQGKLKYTSRFSVSDVERILKKSPNSIPYRRKKRAAVFDQKAFEKMMRIFRHKGSVNAANCHTKPPSLLYLAGDVAYGVNTQFEMEGRTALRLAHLISGFLQLANPTENFGNLRGGGRLHIDYIFGEVVANVMANHRIRSSGIFFEKDQFVNNDGSVREFFGPLAYRKAGSFKAIDTAGLSTRYVDEEWYRKQKSRWGTNTKGLKTHKLRTYVRSDPKGTSSVKHEHFPLKYKGPAYKDGIWSRPTFKCDGRVDDWVVTYSVPIFGLDQLRKKLKFKGVVSVDVPLSLLEINQCPQPFYIANAFKNTARCHELSTSCNPVAGFRFVRGAYGCKCRQGFEYAHADGKQWIEGSLVELEWEKKIRGIFSRYDWLRCRISGGDMTSHNSLLVLLSLLAAMLGSRYCLTL